MGYKLKNPKRGSLGKWRSGGGTFNPNFYMVCVGGWWWWWWWWGRGGGGEVDTSPANLGCSCLDLVCQAESIHIVFGHESVLELLLVNSLAHKLTMMVQTLFHYSIRRGKRIVYQHK